MDSRLAELTNRMEQQITTWEYQGDRRVIFLKCYALMTHNMIQAVANQRFRDPAWVQLLIYDFAEYYFEARERYDTQHPALLNVWRRAFDLALQPTTPAIQNLLMGVNAHINCDLVLVLDDLLSPEWAQLDLTTRETRYHDYCLVNDVIGETINCVQDQVIKPYARLMAVVDFVLGPLDEWCTAQLITNWRADVWQRALAIIEAAEPSQRQERRRATDAIALQRIELLIDGGELGVRLFSDPLRYLNQQHML